MVSVVLWKHEHLRLEAPWKLSCTQFRVPCFCKYVNLWVRKKVLDENILLDMPETKPLSLSARRSEAPCTVGRTRGMVWLFSGLLGHQRFRNCSDCGGSAGVLCYIYWNLKYDIGHNEFDWIWQVPILGMKMKFEGYNSSINLWPVNNW